MERLQVAEAGGRGWRDEPSDARRAGPLFPLLGGALRTRVAIGQPDLTLPLQSAAGSEDRAHVLRAGPVSRAEGVRDPSDGVLRLVAHAELREL